jgi:hypothetical protein
MTQKPKIGPTSHDLAVMLPKYQPAQKNRSTGLYAAQKGIGTACDGCEREKSARLSDGRAVCTWCRDWLLECEARHLLAMPLHARREALQAREQRRGSVQALKAAMARIHAQRGGLRSR